MEYIYLNRVFETRILFRFVLNFNYIENYNIWMNNYVINIVYYR